MIRVNDEAGEAPMKSRQPVQDTETEAPETESGLLGGIGNEAMQSMLLGSGSISGSGISGSGISGGVVGGAVGGALGGLIGGPVGAILGGIGGAMLGGLLDGEEGGDQEQVEISESFKKATAGDVPMADIPDEITLPKTVVEGMQTAWDGSLPGGMAKEQGGILVEKPDGTYEWRAGTDSDSDSFSPNWEDKKENETTRVVGHTHPYGVDEGGVEDVPFSGGDFSSLISQSSPQMDLVQSGDSMFGLVQSKEFRDQIAGLDEAGKAKMGADMETQYDEVFDKTEGTFQEKCDAAVKSVANKYKIAYFKGSGDKLSRVDTSK